MRETKRNNSRNGALKDQPKYTSEGQEVKIGETNATEKIFKDKVQGVKYRCWWKDMTTSESPKQGNSKQQKRESCKQINFDSFF